MKPETTDALRAGRALFNAQQYFEAHEVWEVAWRREAGEPRVLLQALIMVAAGCHKATVNQPRGTVKLLVEAVDKLALVPSLEDFRAQVMQALAHAERWNAGHGEALVPTLVLARDF